MEFEKKRGTKYNLDLNPRPFNAIKAGTKKVEGRVPTDWDRTAYSEMKPGDIISFTNNETGEVLEVVVRFVHHYKTLEKMLKIEGVLNVSSSSTTIEGSIQSYLQLEGYAKNLPKYGIYAIGVVPIVNL